MKYRFFSILPLLLILTSVGCKKTLTDSTCHFSGQIVNPKENKVSLFKSDELVHSSDLNNNNEFSIKVDSLTEGLYTFKHGDEFQYLYLEHGDSLVMRLNTWDFDESLVFTGKGAEKNNYLIRLFLENEKEEKQFYKWYRLEEKDFVKKTDSLMGSKLADYKKFKEQNQNSKTFDALIEKIILAPIYTTKEKYAYNYTKYHELPALKSLEPSFYDYRKHMDINDCRFYDYYAYNNYISNYLLNTSNTIKEKDSAQQLSVIILDQINDQIEDEKLKNMMLHHAIINCLLDKKCCAKDKEYAKNVFYENCTDIRKIKSVKKIVNSLHLLKKDSEFPNLKAIDIDNKDIALTDLKNDQNLVLYFWPKEANRIQYMAKRVQYLSFKYKDFRFIGLDNQLENKNWKAYIKTLNLPAKDQFQLVDTTKNKWFTNDIPRAIILNKEGVIQNDFSYLSHRDFEKLLRKLEKTTL